MDIFKRTLVLSLAVLMLFVAACGGGDDDDGGSEAGGSAEETESSTGSEDCPTEPTTTDSGLQIKEVECGDGEAAEKGDTLEVHYDGRLEDGTKFDASRDHGSTFEFQVGAGQVIQGWDEGLIGMKIGGTRELTIPPELGYGAAGAPPAIPPDSTLVFVVELVDIK
jgi:FKBP-type peptidyl-prolyl cis-trans isomerase